MGAIKLKSKKKTSFSVKLGIQPISQANTSGVFLILFGLAFIAVSALMTLTFVDFKIQFFETISWKRLEEIPKGSKVEFKFLFMISGMFFLAGLKVTLSGIQNYAKLKRRDKLKSRFKNQAWLYDFQWNPQWAHPRSFETGLFSHIIGISIVAGFHLILFKLVPLKFPELFIYIGMGLFDGLIIYGFYISGRRSRRARSVRVSLPSFPMNLGESYNLQIIGLQNYNIDHLEIEIGCYQEVFSYKSKNQSQKHIQLNSIFNLKQKVQVSGGNGHFKIDLPKNLELSSSVGSHPARFWNLHLYAACKGPNLDKHFLLPIYSFNSNS